MTTRRFLVLLLLLFALQQPSSAQIMARWFQLNPGGERYMRCATDPSTGGGLAAPVGSMCIGADGPFHKTGSGVNDWEAVGTGADSGGGGAFSEIQSQTLAADAASITFSNIPQTFHDLQLRCVGRATTSAATEQIRIRFNGDTGANYDNQRFDAVQTGTGVDDAFAATSGWLAQFPAATASATRPGSVDAVIPSYTDTTFHKQAISVGGEVNGTATNTTRWGGRFNNWRSTAAITSVTVLPLANNLLAGSSCTLYGVGGSGGNGNAVEAVYAPATADTSLSSGTTADLTGVTVTLTAGTWLLGGTASIISTSISGVNAWITDASNNEVTGAQSSQYVNGAYMEITVPPARVIIGSTTTYKMRVRIGTSGGTAVRFDTVTTDTSATAMWAVRVNVGAVAPATVVATADESVPSSTTLQNDDVLLCAVTSSKTYEFELVANFTTGTDATVDLDAAFTFPTGGTLNYQFRGHQTSDTTSNQSYQGATEPSSGTGVQYGVLSTAVIPQTPLTIMGTFRNGSTAGNLQFQFAQDNSSATAVVRKAGSKLMCRQVN